MTSQEETNMMPARNCSTDVPSYSALLANLDDFPLSFRYGNTAYKGFSGFVKESEIAEEIDRGKKTTLFLRHPDIPAVFRLETVVYPAESAYEYAVYITNHGDTNTDVFADLGYSIQFEGDHPVISGIKGDLGNENYRCYEFDLVAEGHYLDRSVSGRPSHGVFPYYNLSYGTGGTFIAIGWPGTWYADFIYDPDRGMTVLKMGQGAIATYIAPGETLRTPLMAFVEYEGLDADAQVNHWRHYFIQDVIRKIDGELPGSYVSWSVLADSQTTQSIQAVLDNSREQGVDLDCIWVDAGWYTGAKGETVSWPKTGTLDMDYARFPDGLADIGRYAKEIGALFLLWFEPENMRLDTEEFLRGQPDFKEEWLFCTVWEGSWLQSRIINLGIPECREWIFKKICKVMDEAGVTAFRQDFNNDPAGAWAEYDARTPGRTGMTENQYVQGYLALWDAIIERYGVFIDSCASGGGRNDLESMKRGVPLHYSDWFDGAPGNMDYDMKGKMTQSLFQWFPYFKNGGNQHTLYHRRMNFACFTNIGLDQPFAEDTDWALMRQIRAEYEQIRDYFYGDFYLLTPWVAEADRWDGRMFFDPERGEGFASIACQEAASDLSKTIRLKGLDPQKTYTVRDFDGLADATATGAELMEKGITVTVPEKPYCVILLIRES